MSDNRINIVEVVMQVLSELNSKMNMWVIRWQNYTHKLSGLFFENTKVHRGCKNKEKMMTVQDLFLSKDESLKAS